MINVSRDNNGGAAVWNKRLRLGWLISWSVFAIGAILLFRGFFELRHATICGILCGAHLMLTGMMPCLAGGYHAYCLELRHSRSWQLWLRCSVAYALAGAVELWAWGVYA